MRYKNVFEVLPEDLIEKIQQYVQGEYIYIPIKDRAKTTNPTEYELELQKRDEHIYTKSLEGLSNKQLSKIYCLSESSIRRIIINQRKRYSEMKDRIKQILNNWNIVNEDIIQIYDSSWQIGDKYILKVYDDVNMLNRNIKIVTILADMDIPVGRLVCNRSNATFAKDEQYYYVLTEKLKGNNVVNLHTEVDIGGKMGNVIARLHTAFKECENQDEFWNNSLLEEMNGWIKNTFIKSGWEYVDRELFENTIKELEELYYKLPVGLIHRDVHFGNFLFDNGEFSGYIDFDLSQRNIRIFDLCYFMLGLFSEEEKLGITADKWFEMLGNVFSNYHKIINLCLEEMQAVPYVMESIEFLFIAWFLSQKDIKCAEDAKRILEFVYNNRDRIMKVVENSCS